MEYLSKECYQQLVDELHELINVELPKAKDELVEARAKGDLSENFEYHAAKRALGRLMGKIRFKQRVLQFSQVLDTSKLACDTVGLLRTVEITNMGTGKKVSYTIVNPHEANIKEGKISKQSPVAMALIGKKVGDIVDVKVPSGIQQLRIDNISVE